MDLFTLHDFKVFDLEGFHERMTALRSRIRPKLASIGEELAPRISALVDVPLHVHVAKHMRRTVNPPDDTWAAIGANRRGYKKDVHFKVAISRNCVRLLFEAGPEYYAKSDWAAEWNREFKENSLKLRANRGLAWFKNEHDETPAALLPNLSSSELKRVGDELTRRNDGQLVFGRRIDAKDFVRLNCKELQKITLETFKPLAPLFQLHDARVVNILR
jgi:uncharacterized protein YktB (UPF0637 family)